MILKNESSAHYCWGTYISDIIIELEIMYEKLSE